MRILIVEDDERIVGFMKRGLEAEEFDIDIAAGKSQACDLITTRTYDLLIIDIFLGPDDGLDLCQTLRRRRVGSPILIMTAKGTPETEKASKAAGADAYLAKPFAFEDLLAAIARFRTSYTPSDSPEAVVQSDAALRKNSFGGVYQILPPSSNEHDSNRNGHLGISHPVHKPTRDRP
ncbi:MAG: response regulator transcription factor [Nitrospirota bacterium]